MYNLNLQYPQFTHSIIVLFTEKVSEWNIENIEEEQIFEKLDYGVKLVIPPSSVVEGQEVKTEVKVVTPEMSDIELPLDVELVSCFYRVKTTSKFSKPIELHLQHNVELVSPEACKQLAFIKAKGQPPYKFEYLPLDIIQEFKPGDNSGVVRVADFSMLAIVWKFLKDSFTTQAPMPSCEYLLGIFAKQVKTLCWELEIVVTKNLGPCDKVSGDYLYNKQLNVNNK